MQYSIRKAQKSKSKLRIGMSGPSGSGKTYSALLLASGMTSFDKVVVIDTENGSADLYDTLGDYSVITLEPPYSPENYIGAIKAAEEAGAEVIIIDSVTHEWDGIGGCLDSNEKLAQAKFKGNTSAAWSVTNTKHQRFIDHLVASKCHIITTARSKQETVQIDGKIKKVGTKEIQREGYEYELTLNFNLDREGHLAVASKDRTGLFIEADPFVISKETGETLLTWAEKGIDPNVSTPGQVELIEDLLERKGKSEDTILDYFGVSKIAELSKHEAEATIKKLSQFEDLQDHPVTIADEIDFDEVDQAIEKQDKKPSKKYKETIQ